MKTGILNIELFLHETHSLKQKRFIIQQLKDRLRKKFNISIIEADFQDKWQRSLLAISEISNDERLLNSDFDRILDYMEENKNGFEILRDEFEII
jgi:uncharacterized protein YlxP (DUF503 family)